MTVMFTRSRTANGWFYVTALNEAVDFELLIILPNAIASCQRTKVIAKRLCVKAMLHAREAASKNL
ncbi:MAG: hypothetical protein IH899_20250 [Planctomycetes bacterium]|nr:hypothetical protein [Planctomycetota bacterium]